MLEEFFFGPPMKDGLTWILSLADENVNALSSGDVFVNDWRVLSI